jgi:uncharacterized protein YjbI with pentapeptide repeats
MPAIPWDIRITIEAAVVAVLVLLLLWAIWWLWWRLPKRQVRKLDIQIHDPKARADTEDNFRKTVGQALGGAAVLIGAAVAYLQFIQQQHTATEQIIAQQRTTADQIAAQQKIASDQIAAQLQASEISNKASRDLLISNQVAKGFEQLASDKITMRLGGIYALEGVMNTSKEHYQPVLEALSAFVRDGTKNKTKSKTGDESPSTDIQAVLTVIGRRKSGSRYVDLAGVHFPGAGLYHADLSGAELSLAALNGANLNGANLTRAYLIGADLTFADLKGANLTGANLLRANLTSADLSDADLTGAILNGADLTRAILNGANLTGAELIVRDLTQEQLNQACGKPKALRPEPPVLTLDKPCPPR